MTVTKNLSLPALKLTQAQKERDEFRAVKLLADHYISKAEAHHLNADYDRLRRLARNEVVVGDYKDMLAKYNFSKLNNKSAGTTIKSIPLTSVICRMLKGEKRVSPLNFHVKADNADVENRFLASQREMLAKTIDQEAINALNANGFGTNVPSQEQSPIDEAIANHEQSYQDSRAEAGQEILDGIKEEKDLKERFFECYTDWIETGCCFSLKGLHHNDIEYNRIPTEQCFVEMSSNSPYAEDGQAAVISQEWNIADVLRRFGDELQDVMLGKKGGKRMSAIEWLSTLVGLDGAGDPRPKHFMQNERFEDAKKIYEGVTGNKTSGLGTRTIEVRYVPMNLISPIQILAYEDELGLEQEMEVPEDYVLNELNGDLELETIWVNDIWHVWKIGADTVDGDFAMYPIIERVEPQRTVLNNSSKGKLPINGRVDGLSIPRVLEEFQYQYNIVHLMEARTLGKNGNKPIILPISTIPDNPTWGKTPLERAETLLYYRDTFNVIMVDDSKMNPHLAQLMKSVDMSTLDAVEKFIGLKEQIKADAWDAIGVNRQRQGETYSSDGKATTEQALIRSSIMTADFNITFNKLESSELLGIIDYSKAAYVNGKTFTKYSSRGDYYMSDKSKAVYSLDVEEHCEASYGISVAVAHLENDKLNAIQALAQPFLQNGVTAYQAYKAITTDNPGKAEDYLKQAYEVQRAYEEQESALNRQSQEKISEDNRAVLEGGYQNNLDVANIKAGVDKYKVDVDKYAEAVAGGSSEVDALKIAVENSKLDIERQKVAVDNKKVDNAFILGKEANSIARLAKKTGQK